MSFHKVFHGLELAVCARLVSESCNTGIRSTHHLPGLFGGTHTVGKCFLFLPVSGTVFSLSSLTASSSVTLASMLTPDSHLIPW